MGTNGTASAEILWRISGSSVADAAPLSHHNQIASNAAKTRGLEATCCQRSSVETDTTTKRLLWDPFVGQSQGTQLCRVDPPIPADTRCTRWLRRSSPRNLTGVKVKYRHGGRGRNIKATGTITSSSAALKEKVAPIDDAPCRLWRMLLVNGYTELAVNSEHAIAVNDSATTAQGSVRS
ncbi:MAG: hypothetical protein IPI73_24080, partial [Betaproteobacteria bacterium]|nr:hypothetical protein [Betaproteobacteria bacterium]